MRAFIAVELPAEIKAILAAHARTLSAANIRGLRAVRPEGVHLTLKFLGEISTEQAHDAGEAVRRIAASSAPFPLRLNAAGVFPSEARARVLWVGVGGDLAALQTLRNGVEEACQALCFPRETGAFTPHLTLARLDERVSPAYRGRAVSTHASGWRPEGSLFAATKIGLIRSHLQPGGAVYETVAEASLTG